MKTRHKSKNKKVFNRDKVKQYRQCYVAVMNIPSPKQKFSSLAEQKFISHSKLAVGQGDPPEPL